MARVRRKSNTSDGVERTSVQKLDSYDVPRGGGRLALMGTAYAAAWVAGFELSPQVASVRFFEIAAQVIPVLILVLAVEVRLFDIEKMPKSRRPAIKTVLRGILGMFSVGGTSSGPPEYRHASVELWGRFLFPLALLSALIASELQALGVVADPAPNTHDPRFVYGGLCAALAAILLIAIMPPPVSEHPKETP